MEKKIVLFLILLFCVTGCKKDSEKISIIVPNGIPYMALANLENVEIENVDGSDLLTSAFTSKSHDVIIAPINLGAKTYISGASEYRLAGVLTLGNQYIISRESDSLTSISDLEGKDILAYGKNNIPDITLRKTLDSNSITSTIEYVSSLNDILPRFIIDTTDTSKTNENTPSYCLVTEPLLSTIKVKYNFTNLNTLALTDEVYQAGIFVLEDSSDILSKIEENVTYLNSNPSEYASSIVDKDQYFTNLGVDIIKECIPNSNIVYLNSVDNKDKIVNYFNILNEYNSNILGGKLPNEEFYYQ